MTAGKVGALMVMDGGRLIGIFTERDALNKVLADNLDPGNTKVSEVMTKDPYCIGPATTVGDAMQLITERRFRHLPVVDNGRCIERRSDSLAGTGPVMRGSRPRQSCRPVMTIVRCANVSGIQGCRSNVRLRRSAGRAPNLDLTVRRSAKTEI
jgi:CBS-domain-containing membrane protein